ncbi:MAG: DMT family transporter [Firmicutes bacterium]|nr:DMT family transporter [Bacillota bacterium]
MSSVRKGYILILSYGALLGLIGFFTTTLRGMGLTSFEINFQRFVVTVISLAIYILATRGKEGFKIDPKGFALCVFLGILGDVVMAYLYVESIASLGMAMAVVILYTAPVFSAILARVFLKTPFNRYKGIALVLNFLGCFLAVTGGKASLSGLPTTGLIIAFLCSLFYAVNIMVTQVVTTGRDPITTCFYSFLVGVVCLFFIVRPWSTSPEIWTPRVLMVSIPYGLIMGAFGYVLYYTGIKLLQDASKATVLASIEVAVAALFGIIVYNEPSGALRFLGMALILISMYFIGKTPKETRLEPR